MTKCFTAALAVVSYLVGVDAPESHQSFGNKAEKFVSDMASGSEVHVTTAGKDSHGRVFGTRLAWWDCHHSKDKELAALEASAKIERRRGGGIPSQPVTAAAEPAPTFRARPPDATKSRAAENKQVTVYLTRTGGKFHREGCTSLRSSAIPVSRSEAVDRGYGPCLRCNP